MGATSARGRSQEGGGVSTNALVADAVVVRDGVAQRAGGSPDPWRHPGVGGTEGGVHQLRVSCGGREVGVGGTRCSHHSPPHTPVDGGR